MNLQNIILLGAGYFILFIIYLRTEKRIKLLVVLVLLLPMVFFSTRWATYRGAWLDLGLGVVMALSGIGVWWLLIGRKLPPPKGSTIRVWTKDDPFE